MAIEIVDFPIKNCDFPWQNVSSPEGNPQFQGFFTAPAEWLVAEAAGQLKPKG